MSQVKNWAYITTIQLVLWGIILYPLYRHLVSIPNDNGAIWGTNVVFVFGVLVFAILFAVNSAVHSYFILRYAGKDKLAMDMGFYYMANAGGRLVRTLLSGVLFYYTEAQFGLSVPLWSAGGNLRNFSIGINAGVPLWFRNPELLNVGKYVQRQWRNRFLSAFVSLTQLQVHP